MEIGGWWAGAQRSFLVVMPRGRDSFQGSKVEGNTKALLLLNTPVS